jgi:hypothetical protein
VSDDVDILGADPRPTFFKLADTGALGLAVPSIRGDRGEAVRVVARTLSGMQKEALVASARTGAVWRLASDEGAYLAGFDAAPCPLSFLTTGMVSSYLNEILALAKMRGIRIDDIRLIQDNFYTMKGSARRGDMTGGARDIELEAQIASDALPEALRALVYDAVAASPLNGLMRGCKESLFSLAHNGASIVPAKASAIVPVDQAAPDALFETAAPAPGDWSDLIVRGAMTAKAEDTTTFAGGSLTDEQDRLLHIRGVGALRPDGIKQVDVHLFNPHGSIFRFLCEEAAENGGQGRAPDAASYISAGIAFCFMTQLGRYAKIVRKDLRDYRIVQDTHFSLGGASGGLGRPGETDPVETHVQLQTGEDDDFARACLDMSEQTCFLHAFCRTDLKARIKLSRIAEAAPTA